PGQDRVRDRERMKANPGRELVPGAIRRHDPGSNWGKVVVKAKSLVTVAALVLLAGACTSSQDPAAAGSATAAATASRAPAALPSSSSPSQAAAGLATLSPAGQSQLRGILASRGLSAAAALPDHGELATYPGRVARATGAYTWHRAGISEAHAINAIASGHMRLTTPDGRLLDIVYDRHIEHPSGDWTWIGHLAGKPHLQTVLPIGAAPARRAAPGGRRGVRPQRPGPGPAAAGGHARRGDLAGRDRSRPGRGDRQRGHPALAARLRHPPVDATVPRRRRRRCLPRTG